MTTADIDPAVSRTLTISRVLDAPAALVFRAWTDPVQLPHFWGPHGMTTPFVEMDLKPGGAFRTLMRAPDGAEYPTSGVFLEIVENRRLVFTDAYEPGFVPAAKPFFTAVITFEEQGDGKTLLTAQARHWRDEDRDAHEKMGFHDGWGQSLDRLAQHLDTIQNTK
ncbi:SRPBCC family protein [Azospirillum canadense]|uniref:SRPBCC family protein n=1 Tax=Azospirillum canadense TaxID=403962 RepID=UPI0022270D8F|nr:SRPBCC family protein [Azospirillum canadense]MCW2236848.1 uncharacterized protein YndB with AHSA1/START domain [Azospirillum canadense]